MLEQLEVESGLPLIDIAAAFASLSQGNTPLLLAVKPERAAPLPPARDERPPREDRPAREEKPRDEKPRREHEPRRKAVPAQMETFRLEVGSVHGIKPGNVVGAIANESGIEGVHIGRVDIREDHSYVDLPEGMPKQIFKDLQKVRVAGRELRISRVSVKPPKPPRATIGRRRAKD